MGKNSCDLELRKSELFYSASLVPHVRIMAEKCILSCIVFLFYYKACFLQRIHQVTQEAFNFVSVGICLSAEHVDPVGRRHIHWYELPRLQQVGDAFTSIEELFRIVAVITARGE